MAGEDEKVKRLQEKGMRIVMDAVHSGNGEERTAAKRILELHENAGRIIKLEESLGLSPKKMWRGLFLGQENALLRAIGRNGRILGKNESTFATGRFGKRLDALLELSRKRAKELQGKQRQRRRPARKPKRRRRK